jgi:hypothetical protein
MATSRFERFLPMAGILAAVCFTAFVLCSGSPPGVHAATLTQVAWWHDHDVQATFAGLAGGLFLTAMAFFASGLRQALRSGEPGESTYSSVAYAGTLLVGVAVAVSGWVAFATGEAGHDNEAAAVHTFSYLNDVAWVPWTAASAVMMLGVGIGGLRTATLPRWLAIVSILLGIGNILGPAAIVVFFVTPIWLAACGVVLLRRLAASAPASAAAPL